MEKIICVLPMLLVYFPINSASAEAGFQCSGECRRSAHNTNIEHLKAVAAKQVVEDGCRLISTGEISWYSLPGRKMANGEKMNPAAMIAAHRTLPVRKGVKLKVVNLA